MPFLNVMSKQINRIRILETGGNPYNTNDDTENSVVPSRENHDEEESTLPDELFYGQLNALLG